MGPTIAADFHLIASWAVAVAEALDARDVDSRAVFAEANIDLADARDPTARFPSDRMSRVYELAEEATGDPAFGLFIAQYVHPTSLHALGYSLYASRTMESFCRRIVRYFRFVTTNAVTHLEKTETDYRLILIPTSGLSLYIPQDAWLATIIRFSRQIYRPDFAPLRVCLRRPKPSINAEKFTDYFQAPVEFGSEGNVLILDNDDMHVQLPAANAELARQNDHVVMSLLAQMDRQDVVAQVRASFFDLLPSGDCNKEKVAGRLNMSERTLQGKLSERNTSYRILLNETRRELAEQYISQGLRSVSEVAYLLGFSDYSSFSRAFRAWTGSSPSEYRNRYLRGG
ncbi:MAG: AraC family transcriptional regulator [Gammaproteobacteria bacterium]|nr:MAG: AraC family transcriptional regulator [Gammaproteobacteria bacterium]